MGVTEKKAGRPKKAHSAADDLKGKARILETSIRLFARQGYDSTTVQQIADAAQTNVSMISYYFGGKEKLYVASVETVATSGIEAAKRLLVPPKNREEFLLRVKLYIEDLVDFHVKNPDVVAIIQKEAANPMPALRYLFDETFNSCYRSFESYLAMGQKAGYLPKRIQVNYFAMFYFNAIIGICRSDACPSSILGKSMMDSKYREGIMKAAIDDIFFGLAYGADSQNDK